MNILAAGKLYGPDYFIIVAYFVLMLGVGAYFYRYIKAMKDYFAGGNRIPWWLSGVSYYMSSFSAFAFVAYSGLAYKYGIFGVTFYWVTVPAAAFGVVFFATRWRRARISSPVEYLESRYDSAVRQLFAWQGIPQKIIDDALKIVAIGMFLATALNVPLKQGMFWSSVIMLAYTFMGGLWAVTVTDFLQFVVMMLAVLILFPLSLQAAFDKTGGLSEMIETAPAGFFKPYTGDFNWVYLATAVVLYCLSYSVNWGLVQRYYCVPTEKDAKKVGWLVVVLNIVTPPLMFMPAMLGRYFLPALADPNQAYPSLCVTLLPVGLLGLVVAAMFSATMSMLSTDYNVCASVLTNDVYRRLIRPNASQEQLVLVGRLMTLLVGLISLAVAFYIVSLEGAGGDKLFRWMITLFSVATAPVAVPMLAGLITPKVTTRAALIGFAAGVGVGLFMFFGLEEKFVFLKMTWMRENAIFLVALAVTICLTAAISWLDGQRQGTLPRVEQFLDRLRTPIGELDGDRVEEPARGDIISPFRIVGTSTAIIGVLLIAITPWTRTRLGLVLDSVLGGFLVVSGVYVAWRSGRGSRTETQLKSQE
ncbi:MAG TPA: sodium/solute symporter [Phycisphaerae bacterium]|nr:sodium/solute symporter [Phycisphaerae bacterium]